MFARGRLLPEQVWDGDAIPAQDFTLRCDGESIPSVEIGFGRHGVELSPPADGCDFDLVDSVGAIVASEHLQYSEA